MRIKEKTSQYRRDFTAVYVCDACGAEENGTGYDDSYFHDMVIPAMICNKCGVAAAPDSQPTSTPDVPPGVVL